MKPDLFKAPDYYNLDDLLTEEHKSLFIEELDDLIHKVSIFGFHFATLDIRQDSRKHNQFFNDMVNASIKNGDAIFPENYYNLTEREQIKILSNKERKVEETKDKVEHDGFLISKKLLNKESNRICPVCEAYSMKIKDDVFMNKYECCFNCFIQWVEGREERWVSGWRPTQKKTVLGEQK